MEKILLLLMTLLVTTSVDAQQITEQQALLKAQQFFKGKEIQAPNKARSLKRVAKNIPYSHFYIFNAEDNEGFVIISADSRTKEILGFSESGSLDYDLMPDNMKWWLEYYDKAIAAIPSDMTVNNTRAVKQAPKAEIKALMTVKWNQGSPYNDHCPTSNGKNCLTGCVALAMGQMMAHWKYPYTLPALNAYTTEKGISVSALNSRSINWDSATNDDFAWVARYCGQSVDMNYGTGSSSASSGKIPAAMVGKFGFDKNLHNVYRNGYSKKTWDDMLYNELQNNRPFILSGYTIDNEGHTFICHGYKDGFYLVNWGWGGYLDNYFVLDVMDSENNGKGYSYEQEAVIGIQPPTGGTSNYNILSVSKMEVTSALTVNRNSKNDDFKNITVSWKLENSVLENTNLKFTIGIFKGNTLVSTLVNYVTTEVKAGIYNNHNIEVSFGKDLADGTYQIKMLYKYENETDWILPEGSNYRYVEAVINGNTLTLKNYPVEGSEEPDDPDPTPTPNPEDETGVCFIVWLSETNKHYYILSEKPTVTMNNGNFTLTTTKTTVYYQFNDVFKFTLGEKNATGIQDQSTLAGPTVERLSDKVIFTGCKPKSSVYIYSTGGQVLDTQFSDNDGRAEISIFGLAAGIYVIKSDNVTIKIVKR